MIGAACFAVVLAATSTSTSAGAGAAATEDWLDVSVTVELPDGGVGVGEPFRVVIEATHAPGGVALLPEDLPFDAKLAERRASRKHVRAGSSAKEIDRYELEVLAFEAGEIELPAIPLAYGSTRADTKKTWIEVKTGFSEEEMPVATSTLPEAIAELEKMAAQDPSAAVVLVEDWSPAWIAAATLLALGIAFAAWRYWKTRSKEEARAVEERGPPPRPAHEVALEKIAALRKSGMIERGELKTFHAEVSEILRAYAGGRYGFDSLDLTVPELMEAIGRVKSPGLDVRALEQILDTCDMVKFAKFTPTAAEAIAAIDGAEEIVEKTKPVAPPPSPSPTPSPPRAEEQRP